MTSGEFFGEYEIIKNISQREYECMSGSIEGVQLYFMDGSNFNYNKKFFAEIANILREESELRKKVLIDRENQMRKIQNMFYTKEKKIDAFFRNLKENNESLNHLKQVNKPIISHLYKRSTNLMKKKNLDYNLTSFFQEKTDLILQNKNFQENQKKFKLFKEILNNFNFDINKTENSEKNETNEFIIRTKSHSPKNSTNQSAIKEKFYKTMNILKKNLGDYDKEENLEQLFDLRNRSSSSHMRNKRMQMKNIIHPYIFKINYEGNFDKMIRKEVNILRFNKNENFYKDQNKGWFSHYIGRIITRYKNRNVYYHDEKMLLDIPEIFIEKIKR